MTKYLSKKIKIISLFSIFCVIMIHSYNFTDSFLLPSTVISEKTNCAAMFEYFISNCVARFAVPLFFMMSGYLFFRNYEQTVRGYFTKLKKRVKNLLVPYLLWTAISVAIIVFASLVLKADGLATVKDNMAKIVSKDPMLLLSPPAFQLWYMLELMLFTVISPVIYFLVKKTKLFIIIIAAVLWLFDINFSVVYNCEAVLFYLTGAYFAIFSREDIVLKETKSLKLLISGLIFVLMCIARTCYAATAENTPTARIFLTISYKLAIPFGIYFVWFAFDHIFKDIEDKKQLLRFSNSTFMFYVVHEPLLHLSYEQILSQVSSNFMHIFMYIILPTCTVAVAYIFDIYTYRLLKPIHNVLTGGR